MLLTIAVQHHVNRGVEDPDQAWILGELIRYLEHPKSGALDFSDMGRAWTDVRQSVAAGTLRNADKGLPEVVGTVGPAPTVYSPSSWPRTRSERPVRALPQGRRRPRSEGQRSRTNPGDRRNPDGLDSDPGRSRTDRHHCRHPPGGRIIVSTDLAAPREGRPTVTASTGSSGNSPKHPGASGIRHAWAAKLTLIDQ